jgi:hypothetical protein
VPLNTARADENPRWLTHNLTKTHHQNNAGRKNATFSTACYDPVWPPGLPDAWINLNWWYTGWFPALPEDRQLWVPGIHGTWNTYARWMGEHNDACATEAFAFVVWGDNRGFSTRSSYHPQRRQIDVRMARASWPVQ